MTIDFSVEAIKEKPKRNVRKKRTSKYQPILDVFLESGYILVQVDGTGKKAYNLALNLKNLIKKRGDLVKVSIRNGKVYLERIGV